MTAGARGRLDEADLWYRKARRCARLDHQPPRPDRCGEAAMIDDPAAAAARSAAAILAPDLGQHLSVEVEAALAARAGAQRPERFFDPVSLGALIVSIATLAWTIYN